MGILCFTPKPKLPVTRSILESNPVPTTIGQDSEVYVFTQVEHDYSSSILHHKPPLGKSFFIPEADFCLGVKRQPFGPGRHFGHVMLGRLAGRGSFLFRSHHHNFIVEQVNDRP
jgi:hypothetical protein